MRIDANKYIIIVTCDEKKTRRNYQKKILSLFSFDFAKQSALNSANC